jgi:hypothetical protein
VDETQRGGVQGWREFAAEKRDLIRAFQSAQEKAVSRPLKTEPGEVAEGVFRSWLEGFLPGRYGVTSGYIISAGLPDTQPVKHFDVIIYDKLESPVLWRENNPDKSTQGLHRPIPVEHVLAVLEVKSTLTRRSAMDAANKLRELLPLIKGPEEEETYYPKTLPRNFTCGSIYFRVSVGESISVLEPLLIPELPNYLGAFVLSLAEDPLSDAAAFTMGEVVDEPVEDSGKRIIERHASTRSCAIGGKHLRMYLTWGSNAFPYFAFDLINRMSGRQRAYYIPSMHALKYEKG